MINLLSRAIKHPIDYLGLFSTRKITLKESIDEGYGVRSFFFETSKKINWKAGQHGVFTIPGKKIEGRKWRAFSIASSGEEEVIHIATHISEEPSDFKKKLLSLKEGDAIQMRGPFGEFHLDKSIKQAVGVVGGIGVTPLRAIAYEIVNEPKITTKLDLIFAGKDGCFPFEEEWKVFSGHPNINIIKVNTSDEVTTEVDAKVAEYGNEATYFISGSPGMVSAIRNRIMSRGVTRIINDPFKGY